MNTKDILRCEHSHKFHYTGGAAEKRTRQVVLLTAAMMAVEIVAGWIYHSMALFADGWHMSTHAAALGISWIAFVLARRHTADRRFAFGTWKIEILGGFISGILLGLVGLFMAIVSIQRLFHPVAIQFNHAILVAVIGLAVNVFSILLLGDRHHDDAHVHNSLNLRAAYLHVMADALTSVLAIAALLGGKFLNWNWLDPIMGIVGAVLIVRWTCLLLAETGAILLDRETNDDMAARIHKVIDADADTHITDLHVWKVAQDKYACIIALVAAHPRPTAEYKTRLSQIDALIHVTVETNQRSATGPHA